MDSPIILYASVRNCANRVQLVQHTSEHRFTMPRATTDALRHHRTNSLLFLAFRGDIQGDHVPLVYSSKALYKPRELAGYGMKSGAPLRLDRVGDASGLDIGEPAGNYFVEPSERFPSNVEGEAVVGQSMPHLDTDTCDLGVLVEEHSGVVARNVLDTVFFGKLGLEELLHAANVVADAHGRRCPREVDERIANDLTWAMVCYLSSSKREDAVRSCGLQSQSFLCGLRIIALPSTEGVNRSMFQEEEEVPVIARGFASEQLQLMYSLLELESARIC